MLPFLPGYKAIAALVQILDTTLNQATYTEGRIVRRRKSAKNRIYKYITAIPEEPFNNKFGKRAGRSDGSFCELSKLGAKSTCIKIGYKLMLLTRHCSIYRLYKVI